MFQTYFILPPSSHTDSPVKCSERGRASQMLGALLMEPCAGAEGSLGICPLRSPPHHSPLSHHDLLAFSLALQASAQIPAHSTGAGKQPLAAWMPFVSQILRTDGHSQEVPVLQRPQKPTWLWLCQLKAIFELSPK